jgi:hypothetical protein
MIRFFHHAPGGADRMNDTFDRCHRTRAQAIPFHDGRIHPPHSVQLKARSLARIEKSTALKYANSLFYGNECGAATLQAMITDLQGGP